MENNFAKMLMAAALLLLGAILLIAGFLVPPQGEIHESVLVAFGEILTFAGCVFGMNYHYRSMVSKFMKDVRDDMQKSKSIKSESDNEKD